jgi:hypothetical protein
VRVSDSSGVLLDGNRNPGAFTGVNWALSWR